MTTKPTIDKEILQNLFNDYWKKTEKGKYDYKVLEIFDKYKDLVHGLSKTNIGSVLVKNGMIKNHGTCTYCKSVICPKNRLDICYRTVSCDCGFRGFCKKCKMPYKRDEEGYCFDCYICERHELEKKQKDMSKLGDLEINILYLIKDRPNDFLDRGEYDEFAMAEVLWEDSDQVRESLNSLVDEGYIHKIIENNGPWLSMKLGGPTLDLPDRQIDYPCLTAVSSYFTSPLACELRQVLPDGCPRVFPEQSPLAFLNKEKCLEGLDATEKGFFRDLRFSFVCAHENSIPFLAVQVNEQDNLVDRFDRWKTQVRQKLCNLANVQFVEVRSRKDILRLTNTKSHIHMAGTCLQCQEPYEKDQSKNGYCLKCYVYHCERELEERRKQIASCQQQCEEYRKHIANYKSWAANHDTKGKMLESPCVNDAVLAGFGEKEIWIFYMIKDYAERFMKKQDCDLGKLSTDLEESLSLTAKLLESLIKRNFIIGEVYAPGNRYHLFSAKIVRLNIALPDKKIDFPFLRTVHPIIPSDPANELYAALCHKYPWVIPEQSPSVFLNQEKFFTRLDSDERKRFLNMRFNFVCADEDGRPVLAAQYNGQHNFADKHGPAKRALQKKLCDMANVELLQVNSYKELVKLVNVLKGQSRLSCNDKAKLSPTYG